MLKPKTRVSDEDGITALGCLLTPSLIFDICLVIDSFISCGKDFDNACTGGLAVNYTFILTMAWLGIILLIGTSIISCIRGVDVINIKISSIMQLILSILTVIASLIFLGSIFSSSNPLCRELVMGTIDLWTLFLINLVKSTLFVLCFGFISVYTCYSDDQ